LTFSVESLGEEKEKLQERVATCISACQTTSQHLSELIISCNRGKSQLLEAEEALGLARVETESSEIGFYHCGWIGLLIGTISVDMTNRMGEMNICTEKLYSMKKQDQALRWRLQEVSNDSSQYLDRDGVYRVKGLSRAWWARNS
jgi:hypothetical protein